MAATAPITESETETETEPLSYAEFLARVPKVELHCHFPGAVFAATAIELAAKNGTELPTDDPNELYRYTTITGFLTALQAVSKTLVEREDFARVAYETLADGVRTGNLRYREMFFNPDYHSPQGATYETVVEGIGDGIRRAHAEFGVRCNLIAAMSRYHGPDAAVALVETVLAHPHELVIGVGMDDLTPEGKEAPELFVEAYTLANEHGLNTTAHVGEIDGSTAHDVLIALDVLGVDRIDHGYRILGDPTVVKRARDERVHFTTCPHSSVWLYDFTFEEHPIRQMFLQGLRIGLNTDDPPFFDTDLGKEFVVGAARMGFEPEQVAQLCMNAVEGCWLPEPEKDALREEFRRDIDALTARLR
ncbi:MAG: adenosine deaminase [Actinomycetia bacterium]|nr:adenosine deaminase [Actinomycetes bacterium]